jgi:hypothetical protein
MRKILVWTAWVSFVSTPVAAQEPSSGEAHHVACRAFVQQRAEGEPFLRGACAGTVYALMLTGPLYEGANRFCPPSGSTLIDGGRIVVAYLDRHASERHKNFVTLAHQALREAWPCGQAKE